MKDNKPLELDLSVLSRRSEILTQIHAVYQQEGYTEELNLLLAEHDRAAQAEHDAHIATELVHLSQWEKDAVSASNPNVGNQDEGDVIILDEGDLEIVEVLLTHEEIDALDMSDFDDTPTLVYNRNTEAPGPA